LASDRLTHGYVVFGFGSKGETVSRTALNVPPEMLETWFAVADDGVILVAGHYDDPAPKDMLGKPYLAIFDQDGNVRKILGSDVLDSEAVSDGTTGPEEGGVASGPDGNFYVLKRSEILVVSEWGDVVRRMKLPRPDDGTLALRLELAEGLVSTDLVRIDKDRSVHDQFLVLYSANGTPYGLYRAGTELTKSIPACFMGRSGYVFERAPGPSHKTQLITVLLR
jgi:hypothetical protein